MKQRTLSVGLGQLACGDDREANLATTIDGVREAARRGAELVLLLELHTGRYFCQHEDTGLFDWAETKPGPSSERLATVARELGVVIVASLYGRRAPGLYHHTAEVFDRDGPL